MDTSLPLPLPTQLLRLPRGLWADLEATVIQQDRQFLTEVARTLGLPVAEVLRRCLGTGAPQSVPVLLGEDAISSDRCPWWQQYGDGLWRRCCRSRLSPTLPCAVHERSVPCPLTRLDSDPLIRALPRLQPARFGDRLLWYDPANIVPTYNEDGTVATDGRVRALQFRGRPVLTWFPSLPMTAEC
jgi:hypothetical protein